MPVPDFQTLMRPLLAYGQDGGEKNIGQAIKSLADEFQLTEQERSQLLPSKKQTTIQNRVYWARFYLDKAGAVKKTSRSHFVITGRGRELLQKNPKRIDISVLNQFPEFVAFRTKHTEDESNVESAGTIPPQPIGSATPDEAIDGAEKEITVNLQSQLLESIFERTPEFFERLVLDLIKAMGYSDKKGAIAEKTGGSGDEGFDGIVNEDPLGLDKIYLQAKRYAKNNTIQRPMLQQFAGALSGKGASKGVFITTSSFTSGAREFAKQVPQRPILIDGEKLTKLMIQYGVGVRVDRTVAAR
jgi:restriction system protein